ncbi:MAG: type II toxin-antitoxin system RelE/ParE family toxin [Ignavibacteriae bacterium]|nr:type II toxin-antitoxin system RelE/ParE family toxin [Ignavibacteriota bacterium]
MTLRFHPDAETEFQEAARWYGQQRNGLDTEFMLCIDEALQRIKRDPHLYPRCHREARKTVIRRFPFIIIYQIEAREIQVLAIFHSHRNPMRWKSRVK